MQLHAINPNSGLGKSTMLRTDFLKPLNDLAYCCECAAQDYSGELKSELSELCQLISDQTPGYDAQEVQEALPRLQKALESYRAHENCQGAMLLARVSRDCGKWLSPNNSFQGRPSARLNLPPVGPNSNVRCL